MQTFIPYGDDFTANAKVLDRQRLGKQRVEGLQILYTLTGVSTGWRNHPAVKAWVGHEELLAHYVFAMCDEWTGRGYKDTCRDKVRSLFVTISDLADLPRFGWLVDPEVALSHRANLVRKLPEHYGVLWADIDPSTPYKWA